MLRGKVERKGKWTPMPAAAKAAAHRTFCPCCDRHYGYLVKVGPRMVQVREAIHHIFGRRFLAEHYPDINPHREENLVSVCNICHGAIRVAEDALHRGNVFSYLQRLLVLHFPMSRVFAMARVLRMREVEGWNL
jgi:hypothetical protein